MKLEWKTKMSYSKGNPSFTQLKIQVLQALLASLWIPPRALSHSSLRKDRCLDAHLLISCHYSLSQYFLLPNWRGEKEKGFFFKERGRRIVEKTYVFSVVDRFVNLLVPPHTM